MNTDSLRCAIYCRVSTPEREPAKRTGHNQDLDSQLTPLKEYAASQRWEVIKVYADRESGGKSSKDRPELRQLMADAESYRCPFNVVLFWSLDRLSREGLYETHRYLETFNRRNIKFHSMTEPFLSSLGEFSGVVISLLATVAKQERIRIGERVKAGMANAKAKGRKLGPKIKDVDDVSFRKLVDAGASLADLSRTFGISRATASRRIREKGLTTQGMGELASLRQSPTPI